MQSWTHRHRSRHTSLSLSSSSKEERDVENIHTTTTTKFITQSEGEDDDDDDVPDYERCSFTSSVQVVPRNDGNGGGGFDVYTSVVKTDHRPPLPSSSSSYFDGLPPDHEVFISSLQDFSGSWVEVSTESTSVKREHSNTTNFFARKQRRTTTQTFQIVQEQQQLQQQNEHQQLQQHQQPQYPQLPPPLPLSAPVGKAGANNNNSTRKSPFKELASNSYREPTRNGREISNFQIERRYDSEDPKSNSRSPGFSVRLTQRFGSTSRLSDKPAHAPPPLPSKPPIGFNTATTSNKTKTNSNLEQFKNKEKSAFPRQSYGSTSRLPDTSSTHYIPITDDVISLKDSIPRKPFTSSRPSSRGSSASNHSDSMADSEHKLQLIEIPDSQDIPRNRQHPRTEITFHDNATKETPQYHSNSEYENTLVNKPNAPISSYNRNLETPAFSSNTSSDVYGKDDSPPSKNYTSQATLTLSTRETSSKSPEKRSIFSVPKAFLASLTGRAEKKPIDSVDYETNINRSGYFSSNGSFQQSRVRRKVRASTLTPATRVNNKKGSSTTTTITPTSSTTNSTNRNGDDLKCSCSGYHAHGFHGDCVNNDIQSMKESREHRLRKSVSTSSTITTVSLDKTEAAAGAGTMATGDNSDDSPWNIFWVPSLSFHPYVHGDNLVEFSSLWPSLRELRSMLQSPDVQQSVLKDDGCLGLTLLSVTCGPVRVLRFLLELRLIRVDQLGKDSSSGGLLHLAVLARNQESVHYLMAAKVSPNTRDATGLTADQVCFSPHLRKQLSPRYILGKDVSRDRTLISPSLQDKESIFKLATSPESFVDLQKKLQTLDFNVNTECDANGDFLLHIACSQGLSQLPLLMALIKIQGADIELCNVQGMTALMMAASEGNCVLCDVLICLFGANPNKPNSLCGRSALHYAMEGNHRKTVECLIRRGADVNMEDHSGLRPDDIPGGVITVDDCIEVITFNRNKRLEMLADVVKKGEVASSQLLPYDMCVVDGDGHTLIMMAAMFNRPQSLYAVLNVSTSTINAQHSKTGMTALAIAAQMGNSQAVYVLLKHEACPTVADMNGCLPLHHAIINNHESTVDIFLTFFPYTYQGLNKAYQLCKKPSIYDKIQLAWEKRQYEIVTPKLLGCSLNGDAEELYQLLDEGDNINPKSGTGNWPLYLAVENGHLDVVQLICERGGDICKRHPTSGATALHVAAKMGHHTIVSYLLQFCHSSTHHHNHTHNNHHNNQQNHQHKKPNHQPPSPPSHSSKTTTTTTTTKTSSSQICSLPIPPNPPHTSPSSSRLPSHTLVPGERSSGHDSTGSETTSYLTRPRRYGANKSCRRHRMDINAVDKSNTTALQLAAERGFSRIVDTLLQHGATTAILDNSGQLTTCPQYEGVRIMIESHRQRHTQDIIKCVLDKTKKGLPGLQDIWLPYFDHNLRTKEGQTPLMVAAKSGRIPVIKFLLSSAVYEVAEDEEEEDLSDADSGVLDPSQPSPKEHHSNKDKFTFNQSEYFTDNCFGGDIRPDLLERETDQMSTTTNNNNNGLYKQRRLDQMIQDANRPRGLAIYHDGVVSHVCAVNLQDGTTCFHQCVLGADNPQVLELFVDTDLTPLNVQDGKGETALHLACRLGRKKCVARLLECPGIDVNIRTLDGLLPEELTTVKSVQKMVEKTRLLHPPPPDVIESFISSPAPSQADSNQSVTRTGSSINFDQLHSRYEELKMGGRQQQQQQQQQQHYDQHHHQQQPPHHHQGSAGLSSKQQQDFVDSFGNSL